MAELASGFKTYFQYDQTTGQVYLKYKEQESIPRDFEKLAKPHTPQKGVNAGKTHWRVFFSSLSILNPLVEKVTTDFGEQYRVSFDDTISGEPAECVLSLPTDDLTCLKIVLFIKRHGAINVKFSKFPTICDTNGAELYSELDYLKYDSLTKTWVSNTTFLKEAGEKTWYKACEFLFDDSKICVQAKGEIAKPHRERILIPTKGADFWKAYTGKVKAYVEGVEYKPILSHSSSTTIVNTATTNNEDFSSLDDSGDPLPF